MRIGAVLDTSEIFFGSRGFEPRFLGRISYSNGFRRFTICPKRIVSASAEVCTIP